MYIYILLYETYFETKPYDLAWFMSISQKNEVKTNMSPHFSFKIDDTDDFQYIKINQINN